MSSEGKGKEPASGLSGKSDSPPLPCIVELERWACVHVPEATWKCAAHHSTEETCDKWLHTDVTTDVIPCPKCRSFDDEPDPMEEGKPIIQEIKPSIPRKELSYAERAKTGQVSKASQARVERDAANHQFRRLCVERRARELQDAQLEFYDTFGHSYPNRRR